MTQKNNLNNQSQQSAFNRIRAMLNNPTPTIPTFTPSQTEDDDYEDTEKTEYFNSNKITVGDYFAACFFRRDVEQYESAADIIASLEDPKFVFAAVPESVRQSARVIYDYYAKKTFAKKLTTTAEELSDYQTALSHFVADWNSTMKGKWVGIAATLVFFYENQKIFDWLAKEYKTTPIPDKENSFLFHGNNNTAESLQLKLKTSVHLKNSQRNVQRFIFTRRDQSSDHLWYYDCNMARETDAARFMEMMLAQSGGWIDVANYAQSHYLTPDRDFWAWKIQDCTPVQLRWPIKYPMDEFVKQVHQNKNKK